MADGAVLVGQSSARHPERLLGLSPADRYPRLWTVGDPGPLGGPRCSARCLGRGAFHPLKVSPEAPAQDLAAGEEDRIVDFGGTMGSINNAQCRELLNIDAKGAGRLLKDGPERPVEARGGAPLGSPCASATEFHPESISNISRWG